MCTRWYRGAQPTVALVRDEHDRARVGDAEVRAGDAEVGAKELGAQLLAGECGEWPWRRLEDAVIGHFGLEVLRNLVAVLVHRGGDDVAGRLMSELDDPLAQVGLDHAASGRFERLVEPGLLSRHRLGLHDRARADARGH